MPNPLFEDGEFADEAAGTEDRAESSGDSFDESGSGSGDEIAAETGPDPTESSSIGTSESTDGESSTDANETTGTTTTDGETSTGESSTDTGDMACAGLQLGDACQTCQIEFCCDNTNFGCFDPNSLDGCGCVLDCLTSGGLLDLCALNCGVVPLLKTLANTTFSCIQAHCDQTCP